MDSIDTIETRDVREDEGALFIRWVLSQVDIILEKKPEPTDPPSSF
jgi:hypothetical protein